MDDRYEVSAKADGGRWRAGRQWFRAPVEVGRDEFSDEEWDLLDADPLIVVARPGEPSADPAADDPEGLRAALAEARERIVSLEADLESGAHENARLTELGDRLEMRISEAGDRILGLDAELAAARSNESSASAPAAGAADAGADAGASAHPTREERIRGAVATALETDGPDRRTSTGRPVLSRVREVSRIDDVTAAERDAAWEAVRGGSGG